MKSPAASLVPTADWTQRLSGPRSPAGIACAMAETWQDMGAAMTPVVGAAGVAAVFQRSLRLTALSQPWLAAAHKPGSSEFDPDTLERLLAARSDTEATTVGNALLGTFHDLLTGLVGRPLTRRLPRSTADPALDVVASPEKSA